MSLNTDSVLQQNTGTFSATSGAATLAAGTATGSAVVICAAILGADSTNVWELNVPTGFFQASGDAGLTGATANKVYIFVKRNTSAESSWTLEPVKNSALGNARDVVWAAFEVTGTGLDRLGADLGTFTTNAGVYQPVWGIVNTGNTSAGTETAVATRSTGNTDDSPCYGTLSFAAIAATAPSTTPTAITGHTNGFAEIASVNRVGSTRALTLSVAVKAAQVTGPQETTVSLSPSSAVYTAVVSLFADGARHAPDLAAFTGFGFGTATGITTGSALLSGTAPFDTVVGTPSVVTTNPRSGSYCLEMTAAAAAECLTWGCTGPDVMGTNQPTTYFVLTSRVHVYFPTSLPSADVELMSCEAGSLANGMVVWYRSASQKLGVVVGTGTEVLSDAVVTADKWIGVDCRWDPRLTNHLVDWQVDYDATPGDATGPVAQTQAVGASTSISDPTLFRLGWTTAKTATVRYADVAVSKLWGAYPIGDLRTTVVGPDQAGTPTISGTSTNFKTYTGGPAGTLSTWTAATTRSALAEIPASVGAGVGTGLTQVTAAASDYCEIPMDTFTAAPDYVLRAVRWYAVARAATTASATMRMVFLDTGTQVAEIILGVHGLDPTTPRWLVKMHRSTVAPGAFYQITQTRMDGLRARFGYSTDATPDVALDAVFCEVAYQPATVVGIISSENGAFMVYARQDDASGAVASYLVTTPPGTRGATFYHSLLGVDQTPVYVGPNTTYEQVTAGVDISTVTGVGLSPDAQPE